jgi:hypothetical protein
MPAAAEAFDGRRALLLRAIAVQRHGADAQGMQLTRQPIGAVLGPGEHQRRAVGLLEEPREPLRLVLGLDGLDGVRDRASGPAERPISMYFGVFTSSAASFSTSSGIVAEKSSVCLTGGSCETMRWTSGQKPMSIMRSASSSTSTSSGLKSGVCDRM